MIRGLSVIAVTSGLVLFASFLGGLHPLGDSLAVFRLQFAMLFGVSAVWAAWSRRIRWPLAVVSLAVLVQIGWILRVPTASQADLVIYQKNLNTHLRDTRALIADIRSVSPDMVALQEVSAPLEHILTDLGDLLPYRASCLFYGAVGQVVILSKAPIDAVLCQPGSGLVAAQIGEIWVASIHLHWPFPYRQPEQLETLLPLLDALDGPVIVAGDFNMVPWSAALHRIRRATGTQRTISPVTTLPIFGRAVPLPIDQLLAPGGGWTEARPQFGSDHYGLVAHIALER